MIRCTLADLPSRIRDTYLIGTRVKACGADVPFKAERPPSEIYVYRDDGTADIWRWPASEYADGWQKEESFRWLPDEAMQTRIVEFFFRTWDVIGNDIKDSLRAQGDKWARKVLSKGVLTPKEAYSIIVDHVDRYHDDDEAFAAWEQWHAADFDGSTKAVGSRLRGVGF